MSKNKNEMIIRPAATCAWRVLICLIAFLGIIGVLFGNEITPRVLGYHGTTAGAALAALAATTALGAAAAMWNGKQHTGSALAIAAAISTAAGFVVNEMSNVHLAVLGLQLGGNWGLTAWLFASTGTVIIAGIAGAVLTHRIYYHNSP